MAVVRSPMKVSTSSVFVVSPGLLSSQILAKIEFRNLSQRLLNGPDWVFLDTSLYLYPGWAVVGHFSKDWVVHFHSEGVSLKLNWLLCLVSRDNKNPSCCLLYSNFEVLGKTLL